MNYTDEGRKIKIESKVISLKVLCGKCGEEIVVPFNSYDFSGGSQEMDYENHSWSFFQFKCKCGHEEKIELYGD
jgi:hypothetical protein